MCKLYLVISLAIFTPLAFGQLDSNSITVTASRNITPGQPDQALFGVDVNSGLDTSLDDVIAALQGSGITVTNFSGVNSFFLYVGTGNVPLTPPAPMLDWSFRFAVPFTKTKDTATMLSALQQSIVKKNNALTMSFSIQGTQASAPSQTCSLSDVVADARAQAQKLASAGGVSVGNILAMSGASPNAGISLGQVATLGALAVPASAGVFCTLTIKFALLRF